MNKPIILIGNGGHSTVITSILKQQGKKIIGFTSFEAEHNKFGIPYLGNDEEIFKFSNDEVELVICIGSVDINDKRMNIFKKYKAKGYSFASVIDNKSIISSFSNLGEGVQVMAGAIIEAFAEVSDNTIINSSAVINHECKIGENCHIAPGAIISGKVMIGNNSHIGTGSTILQNIKIGESVLVGACSLVTKNIKDNSKVVGIPAKDVKK